MSGHETEQGSEKQQNLRFLWAAGNLYAEKNPHLSKYLISKFHRMSPSSTVVDGRAASSLYCPNCFSILRPGNHSARLAPKPRLSGRLAKLRQTAAAAARGATPRLAEQKTSQLRRWEQSRTKLLIRCQACHATAKTPVGKRRSGLPMPEGWQRLQQELETRQAGDRGRGTGTPAAAAASRRGFSPKQARQSRKFPSPAAPGGHRAPPGGTPAGPLSASARKGRNLSKQRHQQLRRMLAGAKQEKANTRSPLKDFLVSL